MDWWTTGVVVAVALVLLAVVLRRTGGVFVYGIDDPAIHLTVARRLAYDGTWGIVPGQFQSASSSPLWTLLLAPTQLVARGSSGELVPFVLNLLAAVWVVHLLRPELRAFDPRARPLDALALAVVGVAYLFLPGLMFLGMEHILHIALVLATVLAVERRWIDPEQGGRAYVPFLLMVLATLTRGESAFVVVGLAVGVLVVSSRPLRERLGIGAGMGAAAGAALVGIGIVNLAFGQEILPNSVVLKTFGDRGDTRRSIGAAWDRLWDDPLLGALLVIGVAVLVVAWRRRPGDQLPRPLVFAAVVMVVATLLHVELGGVTRELRYEAYLVALGTVVFLRVIPEVLKAVDRRPRPIPAPFGPALLVLMLLPLAVLQLHRTWIVPDNSMVTYEQRYQVARFLEDNYDEDPIAIGELGYIGLYHDGPLTDIYGLGDHEVLSASVDDQAGPDFWRRLQEERGFRVLAAYDFAIRQDIPDDWILVARWHNPDAYFEVTEFWATVPEEVTPLDAALRTYEVELPDDVKPYYNVLAPMLAARRIAEAAEKE